MLNVHAKRTYIYAYGYVKLKHKNLYTKSIKNDMTSFQMLGKYGTYQKNIRKNNVIGGNSLPEDKSELCNYRKLIAREQTLMLNEIPIIMCWTYQLAPKISFRWS